MSPSLDSRENRELATELKFLVNPELAEQIRSWARARLVPDPNAAGETRDVYRITSLYFDTEQLDVFHRRGSYGRAKFRIRRYGAGQVAFLERKLRTKRFLTKRRSIVKLDELNRLTAGEGESGWAGHWFHRRILKRRLSPVCQVSYLRTARVAMTNLGPIRLTLDDDLRALPAVGMSFSDQTGALVLDQQVVLELKFCFELPMLFKNLVEEFALNSLAFSKYRTAAAALALVPEATAVTNTFITPQYA